MMQVPMGNYIIIVSIFFHHPFINQLTDEYVITPRVIPRLQMGVILVTLSFFEWVKSWESEQDCKERKK
jgi:hypothetical protein